MQIRTTDTKRNSRGFYVLASVVFSVLTLYVLAHFSTFADGYLVTCKQYRRVLVRELFLSGTAMEVIQTRLSCNAVYDFMDYLQPITGDIIRDNFINTSGALLSGIVCSFFSFVCLGVATAINIKLSKN